MSTIIKQCKVCGKDYQYCRTLMPGVFRWQDVACCREHAQIYFAQLEEERSKTGAAEAPVEAPVMNVGDSSTIPVESIKKASTGKKRKTAQTKPAEE